MPELRKDPIVGRWVIISTERGKRPSDFTVTEKRKEPRSCPFCPGNESLTPPEIVAIRDPGTRPNTPGWRLRVISNKYPALKIEGDLNREAEGMFDRMNGIGAHEVVIETPDHYKDLVDLEVGEITQVMFAKRDRMADLKRDMRFKYVMVFKNQGEAAGASLEHSHSQLIATPVVPKRVQEEIEGSQKYFNYKERCVFCDIIRQELGSGIRVVAESEDFAAVTPFASRFPFEIWLLPKKHESNFLNISDRLMEEYSRLLKTVLTKLKLALSDPPYNYVLHTDTLSTIAREQYHWHLEIIPKLSRVAGFEWGTGFYINPVSPEDASAYLREIETK